MLLILNYADSKCSIMHMLLAMPFIPVPHMKDAFEFVKSIAPDVPGVHDFRDYFDSTGLVAQLILLST